MTTSKGLLTYPAAFGRLCVETRTLSDRLGGKPQPPSGGCVLKLFLAVLMDFFKRPAAFGRLCVETESLGALINSALASRLRAAVC